MAKTNIDDIKKGTEELEAVEQKATKGGMRATLGTVQKGTIAAGPQQLYQPVQGQVSGTSSGMPSREELQSMEQSVERTREEALRLFNKKA